MENISNQQLQEEIHLLKAKNAQLEEILSKSKFSVHKNTEDILLQRENYLSALNESKKILLSAPKENAFQQFVDVLGAASNASRTYIFINHNSPNGELLMSQKAEYCAVGIVPEIDNPELQNLKYDDFFERWHSTLSKGDLILGKIEDFPTGEKEFLKLQEIKSVLVIPIITDNNFIGFIGFDNCTSEEEWNNDEQYFLRVAANDLAQFIEKSRIQERIKAENLRFQVTMDALDAVVYVSDIETYEILYLNKRGKSLVGDKIGEKCFLAFQSGQSSPCSFCTNHLIVDKNGKPNSPHNWEFQNTVTKRWHQLSDQAIYWPDGRIVRLEVAVDITDRKKAEETIKQNLEQQKLISSISSNFVGKINLDKEINNLIKTIGEYSNAERAYVFLFSEDGRVMDNTHEWCAEGISPEIDNLQNKSSKIYPWWMSKLLKNEIIHIEDVSKLPKEASIEKKLLERQGIKSIIEIPLNIFGKLIGFMGVDNNTKSKSWPIETINVLKTSAEILANTLHSKKAEDDLRDSEERLKILFESAPDAYYLSDKRGTFLDGNKAAEDLIGYKREELLGKNFLELKILSTKQILRASKILFNSVLGNGSSTGPDEFVLRRKDGSKVTVEIRTYPVTIKNKTVILGIAHDISELKRIENSIRESEKRFKKLSDLTFEGLYIHDKGIIIDINLSLANMFGYSREELIGKNVITEFAHKDYHQIILDNITKNHTLPYEILGQKKDGTLIPLEVEAKNIKTDSGETVRVTALRDITIRKQAEKALNESQDRFKALSEATYEGILISENGVILDVNQAICDLTGYSYDDFIGRRSTKFILHEKAKAVSQNIISGNEKPYKSIVIRKDGSQLHVEFQGKMFKYKGANTRVTAVRDITERNKNETIINESKIKLEKLNSKLVSTVKEEVKKNREKDHMMIIQSKQAAMGEMIGNIAHQWRQPLNDIGLYVQNLQDKYEYNDLNEDSLTDIVNRTMNKLEYMSQTIDDFRNFFRSDKEKIRFSLSDSINKTILLTEASFANSKIEVELNLQENIFFNGYPNEFSQALLNILNNAKDELIVENIQNPCVKISLTKSEKKITIIISNNGSEIPNEIIDRIFNPYFTTKPIQIGTGLGLYISKTIIERNMGGKLYAQNTNNSAEFIINLYY